MAGIRTILAGVFTGLGVLFGLPWFVLWTILTGRPDLMYRVSMKFCRMAYLLAGVRVQIEGLDHIPSKPCIFAANHASNLDPLILLPSIPRRAAIFAKRSLFRIPIFATGMRLAGFIPVDRGGKDAARGIARAEQHLREGTSVAIFPEGTRSADGRLHPLKKGAFAIAMKAEVPVVPVSIAGTQKLLRRGEWIVRPGSAKIRFGRPVDASHTKSREGLLSEIEALIAAGLPLDQQPQ